MAQENPKFEPQLISTKDAIHPKNFCNRHLIPRKTAVIPDVQLVCHNLSRPAGLIRSRVRDMLSSRLVRLFT